jgi:hypothetical protein
LEISPKGKGRQMAKGEESEGKGRERGRGSRREGRVSDGQGWGRVKALGDEERRREKAEGRVQGRRRRERDRVGKGEMKMRIEGMARGLLFGRRRGMVWMPVCWIALVFRSYLFGRLEDGGRKERGEEVEEERNGRRSRATRERRGGRGRGRGGHTKGHALPRDIDRYLLLKVEGGEKDHEGVDPSHVTFGLKDPGGRLELTNFFSVFRKSEGDGEKAVEAARSEVGGTKS